jgi:hypothetical protein
MFQPVAAPAVTQTVSERPHQHKHSLSLTSQGKSGSTGLGDYNASASPGSRQHNADVRHANRNKIINSNSLAAALEGKLDEKSGSGGSGVAEAGTSSSRPMRSFAHTPGQREHSPFATDATQSELESFDALDRELTTLMTEKKELDDEQGRLHQRGGKTLKERTRLKQVEARLLVLGRDVSGLRKKLALKPG